MSLAMSTALSALMASQRMAEITSHNVANVNTPGFSRQEGILKPSLPVVTTAGIMGTGVTIDRIVAIRDEFLNQRIGSQKTNLGKAEAQSKALAELENIIMPGADANLGNSIDEFFRSINELVGNPQSEVPRESVRQSALMLADMFHMVNGQLRQLQTDLNREFDQTVEQANSLLQQIADLNWRIVSAAGGSDAANDLVDERNLYVEELSRLMTIQVTTERGSANVLFEGRLVVSGTDRLELEPDAADGRLKLCIAGTGDTFETTGGALGAQAELYDETLPRYIEYFDQMAKGLIREFNATHATGVGLQNGYTTLTSTVQLADLDRNAVPGDEPLAQQALAFPPVAGKLYITVTNDTTGEMHRASIDYDPAVDSVNDIAAKIAAVPYMNASVTSGYLTMTAWPGCRFDFSNKLLPDGGSLGTSQISVSGAYAGSSDRSYTFYAMNTGTVGQAGDLRIAVVDDRGRSLGLLNVGKGYTPGTPLSVADGVSVSFGAGALTAAGVQTAAGPFALADGDQLTISLDGGPAAAVTFHAADFSDIAAATAQEVAAAINAAGAGVRAAVVDGTVMIVPEVQSASTTISAAGAAAPKLGIAAGTVSTDSRSVSVLGQTDTGGLLTALGINPFFEGDGSGNITLAAHIRADVGNIAAAKSSPPGDNANAVKLAQVKARLVLNGTSTLNEYYSSVVGKVGIEASQASRSQETQTKLVENLESQRNSIAGVSLEEEMAKLMQNQQAYYAAIRLLKAVDEMLQSLMTL